MIRLFIFMILGFVAFVVFVSIFLQPSDLKNCPASPNGVAPCQKVDAIVAVSGGDTDSRADEAISLYKKGWANYIVFSGAALDKSGPSNAAVMKSRAIAEGIDANNIFIDETSETTKQNASNTDSIFTKLNIKTAILVTSGYHQRRANLEFVKNTSGVSILNYPVEQDHDWSSWWWISPRGWYLAVAELVKIVIISFGVNIS